MGEFTEDVAEKAKQCRFDFRTNKCEETPDKVPALEKACNELEKCMEKDPYLWTNRAKLAAEIFRGVLKSFAKELDGWTIGAIPCMVFAMVCAAYLCLMVV